MQVPGKTFHTQYNKFPHNKEIEKQFSKQSILKLMNVLVIVVNI